MSLSKRSVSLLIFIFVKQWFKKAIVLPLSVDKQNYIINCKWSLSIEPLEPLFSFSFCGGIPTQVFSCKYCEIFKKIFFYGTPLVAASEIKHRVAEY